MKRPYATCDSLNRRGVTRRGSSLNSFPRRPKATPQTPCGTFGEKQHFFKLNAALGCLRSSFGWHIIGFLYIHLEHSQKSLPYGVTVPLLHATRAALDNLQESGLLPLIDKIRLLGFTRYTTSTLRSSAMLGPSHPDAVSYVIRAGGRSLSPLATCWRRTTTGMLDERALSLSPRVAFGALSVPSHAATRCFQRATFRALTLEQQHAAAGGWLRLPGGGQVLLHYVMSSPATAAEAAALRSENATHRDLDALPVRHRESACAEKIFVWLALASRRCAPVLSPLSPHAHRSYRTLTARSPLSPHAHRTRTASAPQALCLAAQLRRRRRLHRHPRRRYLRARRAGLRRPPSPRCQRSPLLRPVFVGGEVGRAPRAPPRLRQHGRPCACRGGKARGKSSRAFAACRAAKARRRRRKR